MYGLQGIKGKFQRKQSVSHPSDRLLAIDSGPLQSDVVQLVMHCSECGISDDQIWHVVVDDDAPRPEGSFFDEVEMVVYSAAKQSWCELWLDAVGARWEAEHGLRLTVKRGRVCEPGVSWSLDD